MHFINNLKRLLLLSKDMEANSDPKQSSNIRFCHWNLNFYAAHGFIKVPYVETYIKSNNSDTVCLPQTFLDSTTPNVYVYIQIYGYSLLRADHPNDVKREVIYIYFKNCFF